MSELIDLLLANAPSPDVTRRAERLIIEAVLLGMEGVGMDELPPLEGIEEERATLLARRRQLLAAGGTTDGGENGSGAGPVSPHTLMHSSAGPFGEEEGASPLFDNDDFEALADDGGEGSAYFVSHAIALPSGAASPASSPQSPAHRLPQQHQQRPMAFQPHLSPIAGGRSPQPSASPTLSSSSAYASSPPHNACSAAASSGARLALGLGGGHSPVRLPPIATTALSANGRLVSVPLSPQVPPPLAQTGGGVRGRGVAPLPAFSPIGASSPGRHLLPPISKQQSSSPSPRASSSTPWLSPSASALGPNASASALSLPCPAMSPKGLRYLNARHPSTGATALHIACDRGHFGVVWLLVASGADTNLLDGADATAADAARGRGMLSPPPPPTFRDDDGEDGYTVLCGSMANEKGAPDRVRPFADDDDDEEVEGWPTTDLTSGTPFGMPVGGYTALQSLLRDGRHPQSLVAAAAAVIIGESFVVGVPPTEAAPSAPLPPPLTYFPKEVIRGAVTKEYLRRVALEKERAEKERLALAAARRAERERLRRANSYSSPAFYQAAFDANVKATAGRRSTALHFACELGHYGTIPRLLVAGADPNVADDRGVTPLLFLLANNLPYPRIAAIARQLIEAKGFDALHRDADGRTALHAACQHKHLAVVPMLIAAGADPNARDGSAKANGNTALHWLLSTPIIAPRRAAAATTVVAGGGGGSNNQQQQQPQGRAAYYPQALITAAEAIIKGPPRKPQQQQPSSSSSATTKTIVSSAVSHRFVADTRNEEGRTPLHYACDYGHTEIALQLLRAGADAGAADGDGLTPLHVACPNSFTIVQDLLEAGGADANAVDNSGRTPIDVLQGRYYAIKQMVADAAKRGRGGWGAGGGASSSPSPTGSPTRRGVGGGASPTQQQQQQQQRPLALAFVPPDFSDERAMAKLMDLFDAAFDVLRGEGGERGRRSGYAPQRQGAY